MKIDQHSGSGLTVRVPARSSRAAQAGAAGEPGSVKPQDGGMRLRAQAEPAARTFDARKVEAIRDDIRAGRYRIDPDRIADGMIASLLELTQGGKA